MSNEQLSLAVAVLTLVNVLVWTLAWWRERKGRLRAEKRAADLEWMLKVRLKARQ